MLHNIFTITRWSATLRLFKPGSGQLCVPLYGKRPLLEKDYFGRVIKIFLWYLTLVDLRGLSGRLTFVVKVHTYFYLYMCGGTFENMTLRNLPLFAKWTSDTLQTCNLKFKTSRTEFRAYLGEMPVLPVWICKAVYQRMSIGCTIRCIIVLWVKKVGCFIIFLSVIVY